MQHVALPTGPGSFSEWTPVGAATAWEAWANDLQSSWALTTGAAQRALVTFEPLPGDAVTVSRVTLLGLWAGDDAGSLRPVLRLAGVNDATAPPTVPFSGGYQPFQQSYALAPDGGAWTVAKRNALEAGLFSVLAPLTELLADSLRLATDYEVASPSPDPPGPVAEVRMPDAVTFQASFGETSPVRMPDTAAAAIDLPDSNPVDIRLPDHGAHSVSLTRED